MENTTTTKSGLIIIKLGGSVITYKDSPIPKARIDVIKNLASQIKKVVDLEKYKIILVHGAGSFAHGLVKKYDLHRGMKTEKQILGFSLVTRNMIGLNNKIMGHLLRAKLKAVSIISHTFITQSAGKLTDFNIEIIKSYLENNQIPVLFGDVVLDDKWGCSVLSGDTIVCYLAQKLKADKVIFLSDVDGIFDSDPNKNPKAKLIAEINNQNLNKILKGLSPTGRDDVTGEMYGKILYIKKYLLGIPVYIAKGLSLKNLMRIIHQRGNITRIVFD